MKTRALIEQLRQFDPDLEVWWWDSKSHRFTEKFVLSGTLFDELLITPLPENEMGSDEASSRPEPRNQMHFQIS